MSTVELYDQAIWPIVSGENTEVSSEHFEQIRKHMWLLEHPCAGNLNTTELYGKWVGSASGFEYVEYNQHNWTGWNPGTDYHFGDPIVKYRWGPLTDQVDIFVFFANDTPGDMLDSQPPIIGGQLNSNYWLLGVDPNKYAHWNKNAGRPDIGAEARWIINEHGYEAPPDGQGWLYGRWEAWRELPVHTDPFEQIPHIKQSGTDEARHSPVEQIKDNICKSIKPSHERTFQDGYVGIPPAQTWWVHRFDLDKVSEYAIVSGDPVGSTQTGPNYVDPNMNMAYQDRAMHLIESNYQYMTPVSTFWKERWQYWNTYGIEMDTDHDDGCVNKHTNYAGQYQGSFTWPHPYSVGDVVYYNYYWWRCIRGFSSSDDFYAPGGPNSDNTWVKPLHQPDYISTDPLYVQFSDYLFGCNSSAFEKVLDLIGNYDWYWDKDYPAVPWWMYQKHYYYMTLHRSDPNAGHNITAQTRYPIPRGCWRKVWRYTMEWDHGRAQKARLGKEINIDGQTVSMIWPGELGAPPGLDYQFVYYSEAGGVHYNYRIHRHVITQAQWDAMERPAGAESTYTQFYIVMDVEELFKAAYRNSSSIESRIKDRHDPLATEWLDDGGTMKEYPIYEIHPDLVNDIKDALEQLILLKQQTTITGQDYTAWSNGQGFATSLAAYSAGKAECESKVIVAAQTGFYGNVGHIGFVPYNVGAGTYDNVGTVTHDYQMELAWTEVTITRDTGVCFPATSVGTLIFDVLAMGSTAADAPCAIGAGSFVFTPPEDDKWYRAYVGQIPVTCEHVHDGAGDDASDWTLVCTFQIVPAEPWPPDAMFTFDGAARGTGKDYYRQTNVNVTTGSNLAMAWKLNFDGFESSVFEQDSTNFIEV